MSQQGKGHPSPSLGVLAQLLRLLVRHINVVEATEKGSQDDHEDEHEPEGSRCERSEQVSTLEVGVWEKESGKERLTFLALCFYLIFFLLTSISKKRKAVRHRVVLEAGSEAATKGSFCYWWLVMAVNIPAEKNTFTFCL